MTECEITKRRGKRGPSTAVGMTEREERSLHCASAKSADATVGMTSGVGGNNCRIVRIVELASESGDSRVGGFAGVAVAAVGLDGFVRGAAHRGRLAPV